MKGAPVDIRVTVASPSLTDLLSAPPETEGALSCWERGRAVLNAARWERGDIAAYRVY